MLQIVKITTFAINYFEVKKHKAKITNLVAKKEWIWLGRNS
jgi:hypothetical protein